MSFKVELKVKDILEQKNISQKRLADIAGLRESTISDIVRGTRTVINFQHLSKIAEALNIQDISLLIDFVTEQNSEDTAWEQDVYECIKSIKKKSITLQDAYGFMGVLKHKHPNSSDVDSRIKRVLRVLEKKRLIVFDEKKELYRVVNV